MARSLASVRDGREARWGRPWAASRREELVLLLLLARLAARLVLALVGGGGLVAPAELRPQAGEAVLDLEQRLVEVVGDPEGAGAVEAEAFLLLSGDRDLVLDRAVLRPDHEQAILGVGEDE